jgi:hypothetical protein
LIAWSTSDCTGAYYGGCHHSTQNTSAYAAYTFTGVAVYYLSALWPFEVHILIALDGGPTQNLDLEDYSQPNIGPNAPTVQSAVVWSKTNLSEGKHVLVISVPVTGWGLVDGFMWVTSGQTCVTRQETDDRCFVFQSVTTSSSSDSSSSGSLSSAPTITTSTTNINTPEPSTSSTEAYSQEGASSSSQWYPSFISYIHRLFLYSISARNSPRNDIRSSHSPGNMPWSLPLAPKTESSHN